MDSMEREMAGAYLSESVKSTEREGEYTNEQDRRARIVGGYGKFKRESLWLEINRGIGHEGKTEQPQARD